MLLLGPPLNLLVLLDSGRHEVQWALLAPMLAAALPGLALGVLALELLSKPTLQVRWGRRWCVAAGWQMRRRGTVGCAGRGGGTGAGAGRPGCVSGAAHHVDQRERPADRAVAGGARTAPGALRASLAASFLFLNLAGGIVVVVAGGTGAVRLDVLAAAARADAGGPRAGDAGVPADRGAALLAGGPGPGGLRRRGEPRAGWWGWRHCPRPYAGAMGACTPCAAFPHANMCSYRWSSASSTRASSSWRRWGTAGRSSPSPPPWRRRRVASRWWARSRRPAEAFGVVRGMRHGGGAVALSGPQAGAAGPRGHRAPCGVTCSTGWRGSGRRWSRIARGRRSSRRSRSRASTAATSTGCWRAARRALGPGARFGSGAQPLRRARRGAAGASAPARRRRRPVRGCGRGRGACLAGVPRPAAGLASAHPAGAPGAARDPRAARDQDAGRARRAALAGAGRALRAPGPAGARPGPGARHAARAAAAARAGHRAARPAGGRLGPAARAGPRAARGPGARPARAARPLPAGGWPCPRASWPAAPGGWP